MKQRGQVLSKPGSIHPHTKFKGQVYVSKKEEVEDTHHSSMDGNTVLPKNNRRNRRSKATRGY